MRPDAHRLRVLEATRLLDSPAEKSFDRITRLATRLLGVPVSVISLVDGHRQFFKSAVGLADPWASKRETPLTHSFCKHVVADRDNLVVEDARRHPLLRSSLAVEELGVVAYAGVPLTIEDEAIGAFCAVDSQPHAWSDEDVATLEDLASSVVAEIELRMAARAVIESAQVNRAIMENLPNVAAFVLDRELRYVGATGSALKAVLDRAKMTSIIGRRAGEGATDGSADEVIALYRAALEGTRSQVETYRHDRSYDLDVVPIVSDPATNEVDRVLVCLHDVTERKREVETLRTTTAALARERALFEATFTNVEEGILLLDENLVPLLVNDAFVTMTGLARDRIIGRPHAEMIDDLAKRAADPEAFRKELANPAPSLVRELSMARPQRRIVRVERHSLALEGHTCRLVVWHDVTAERDLLAERERELHVDALTGIANRRAFEKALGVEDARRKRNRTPLSVLVFDIDFFKKVNDVHGHDVGDLVLKEVASVLAATGRVTDLVARWGGEEFAALVPETIQGAVTFGERARQAVAALAMRRVGSVTISCGVAEVASDEAPSDALKRADERLYDAKRGGRNRVAS